MHDSSVREKFIELRAQGKSFASISEELGVSKTTLIDWSRESQEIIANLRAINEEGLREKCKAVKEHQLKVLSDQLDAVKTELANRDLKAVSTDKLYNIMLRLMAEVRSEDKPLTFVRTTSAVGFRDPFEQTVSWTA